MFGLENGGETLIFKSFHFDETVTILISHFLCFGALKILTGDYFVLRINQIIYSKQKIGCFIQFSIFHSTFFFFPARFFFKHICQKMRGGKHVKVKKRRRQDILRFCADARKLILGSIGIPPWPLNTDILRKQGTMAKSRKIGVSIFNSYFEVSLCSLKDSQRWV